MILTGSMMVGVGLRNRGWVVGVRQHGGGVGGIAMLDIRGIGIFVRQQQDAGDGRKTMLRTSEGWRCISDNMVVLVG